jgi:Flp pilus assembly protein TadD
LAWHHWLARRPDEAVTLAERTRELDPNVIWASYFAGLALEQKGSYEEAAAEFRRAQALSPQMTLVRAALGHALGHCGETREARKILIELEKQRPAKFVPAYDIAMVRLGLGEKAAALDWLNEAAKEHSGWVAYLKVEPRLDALRAMPEFGDLLARVGLHSAPKPRPTNG